MRAEANVRQTTTTEVVLSLDWSTAKRVESVLREAAYRIHNGVPPEETITITVANALRDALDAETARTRALAAQPLEPWASSMPLQREQSS